MRRIQNDFEQWAKEFAWKGESTYAKMKGLAGYIYTLGDEYHDLRAELRNRDGCQRSANPTTEPTD